MRHPATVLRSAFSLLELLAVIAVLGILMAFLVPAVGNFGRSTALVSAGNRVANLAGFARQTAITKSTMAALVLLCAKEGGTDADNDPDYRSFAVLEYSDDRGWSLLTAWETLPVGIIVDHPASGLAAGDLVKVPGASFFTYSPVKFPFIDGARNGLTQENPPVRFHGRKITRFATRIFMPGGGLKNPDEPAQLRLVEGFLQDGRTIYTKPDGKNGSANFYDLALIGATGITKISRP